MRWWPGCSTRSPRWPTASPEITAGPPDDETLELIWGSPDLLLIADVMLQRTQWCHGAPGFVASVAALPPDEDLDSLLLAGGELTWAAGPFRKGAGLCHGTAGNGLALVKLFTRTGDESWLQRARRFAMHSAAQVEAARRHDGRGRYSLWTGDVGTAIYLHQCLEGASDVPTIDIW